MKVFAPFVVIATLAASPVVAADVAGSTSAIFQNPSPSAAITTGIGTSAITWGSGSDVNRLTFFGSAFVSAFETPFKVGTLSYYNGTIGTDTGIDSVNLALNLNFLTPSLPPVTSVFTFDVVNTPNSSDPVASADYLYFPSSFSTTTFVIGTTTYNVKLTGFQNIVGDGFLTSDSTQLHVEEDKSARADLYAVVTTQTASVPEAASWAMMVGGFGLLGTALRRKRVGVRFA